MKTLVAIIVDNDPDNYVTGWYYGECELDDEIWIENFDPNGMVEENFGKVVEIFEVTEEW